MARKRAKAKGRPWIGIMYDCCHIYGRIYLDKVGKKYTGGCPKCGRKVEAKVSPYAKPGNFFRVQ